MRQSNISLQCTTSTESISFVQYTYIHNIWIPTSMMFEKIEHILKMCVLQLEYTFQT
jgi:hypothetical protein